ncbi:MAG: alpha/beta fold hydrolase, partial [Burkholderiaceae bacterium]
MTAPIYQFVNTPLLRVGYRAFEPARGTSAAGVVMLLHGWPDSPDTWDRVVPHLVQAGYRVIVPALRGFSPTTFLNADTPRTGQLAALGRDLVDLIGALGIHR